MASRSGWSGDVWLLRPEQQRGDQVVKLKQSRMRKCLYTTRRPGNHKTHCGEEPGRVGKSLGGWGVHRFFSL